MVEASNDALGVAAQCRLLGISRSGWDYERRGESADNLALMQLIDAQFLQTPFYGSRQMVRHPYRQGYEVGRRRVRRLMRLLGIEAVYQKPRTSDPHPGHRIYPYRLKCLTITRPNHVWCADITYIRVRRGFFVSGGDHGLGEPEGSELAAFQHHGDPVLRGGSGGSHSPLWAARGFQHRPGQPVHGGCVDRRSERKRDCDLDGWQGKVDGQRVYRAAVAEPEI